MPFTLKIDLQCYIDWSLFLKVKRDKQLSHVFRNVKMQVKAFYRWNVNQGDLKSSNLKQTFPNISLEFCGTGKWIAYDMGDSLLITIFVVLLYLYYLHCFSSHASVLFSARLSSLSRYCLMGLLSPQPKWKINQIRKLIKQTV